MNPGDLLEPLREPVTGSRGATPLSRYSEAIVRAFIESGADSARVRVEDAEFGFDELYGGMRSICRRVGYRRVAEVHRQGAVLALVRRKR